MSFTSCFHISHPSLRSTWLINIWAKRGWEKWKTRGKHKDSSQVANLFNIPFPWALALCDWMLRLAVTSPCFPAYNFFLVFPFILRFPCRRLKWKGKPMKGKDKEKEMQCGKRGHSEAGKNFQAKRSSCWDSYVYRLIIKKMNPNRMACLTSAFPSD